MGNTSFNPVGELIVLRLTVGGVDPDTFRNVFVALDTGASTTMIPTKWLWTWGMTSQTQMNR